MYGCRKLFEYLPRETYYQHHSCMFSVTGFIDENKLQYMPELIDKIELVYNLNQTRDILYDKYKDLLDMKKEYERRINIYQTHSRIWDSFVEYVGSLEYNLSKQAENDLDLAPYYETRDMYNKKIETLIDEINTYLGEKGITLNIEFSISDEDDRTRYTAG